MNSEDNVVMNGFEREELDADPERFSEISEKLDDVLMYLKNELAGKNQIINAQSTEIQRLRSVVDNRQQQLEKIQLKLEEFESRAESNRQLINKLLGDISHYQNDIEWYKRTYEKRSFWGVMKEKIAKVTVPQKNQQDAIE
jgi:chromosome segregation ATPase